jgi:hypothetical protein
LSLGGFVRTLAVVALAFAAGAARAGGNPAAGRRSMHVASPATRWPTIAPVPGIAD